MSENTKLKVDILKSEYQIIRDKLLLFSSSTAGSFAMLLNDKLPFIGSVVLYATFTISFGGVLLNLQKAGKIQKELETIKEINND